MRKLLAEIGCLFLLLVSFSFIHAADEDKLYELVIRNGKIFDGTGSPWFLGDIAIKDKKIVKIGRIETHLAQRILDAQGLIVAPGFIDIHTHCDRGITRVPTVDNYLLQGVTTVVGGNCGGHPFPLAELFSTIEKNGISPNFACLIGHNTIRREVM